MSPHFGYKYTVDLYLDKVCYAEIRNLELSNESLMDVTNQKIIETIHSLAGRDFSQL